MFFFPSLIFAESRANNFIDYESMKLKIHSSLDEFIEDELVRIKNDSSIYEKLSCSEMMINPYFIFMMGEAAAYHKIKIYIDRGYISEDY